MRAWPALLLAVLAASCATAPAPRPAGGLPTALRADPMLLERSAIGDARSLALDLLFGQPGAADALAAWVASHPAAAADDRAGAELLLCEEFYRRTLYRQAAAACRAAEAISPGAAGSFIEFIAPLESVAATRWDVSGLRIPLFKDSGGTRRLKLAHAGREFEAVVDTGAELTIVMESVARDLGAQPLGSASIETTTTPVAGSMVRLDSVEIAGATLRNLPALVLPDEQLTFDDGSSLPVVLALPALTSSGKAAFLEHGRVLALGDAVPEMTGASAQLYWDASGVGFEARFAGGGRAVHFDSGSERTYLYPSALPSLSEAERAGRVPFERKIAGLGGERVEQASRIPAVRVTIAGREWTIAPIEVAEQDEAGEAARIGVALLDQFETVVLDFGRMRMFVR